MKPFHPQIDDSRFIPSLPTALLVRPTNSSKVHPASFQIPIASPIQLSLPNPLIFHSHSLQHISKTLVLSIREIHECVLITQHIIDWTGSIAFLVLEEEDYVQGYGSDDGYTVAVEY